MNSKAKAIIHDIRVICRVLKRRDTPWCARLVAACAIFYVLSPIQLIPSFIPVVGQLDDLLVVYLGMKLLGKLVSRQLLAECEGAQSGGILENVTNV